MKNSRKRLRLPRREAIKLPDTITTPASVYTPPASSIILHSTAYWGARGIAEPVPLVQYDDTLPIIAVALYLDDQPYTLPEGAAINIRMAKGDGTYVYDPALGISEDRQTAYIAVTYQMTVVAGDYCPILELVVGGNVAGTSRLPLHIATNPVPEDAIASTDEYKTIQQLVVEVEAAAQIVADNEQAIKAIEENLPAIQAAPENAKNAEASASLAQSWAVGGTGTREGEDTDNAKYYAALAQQVSQGAVGYYESPQALQSAHPTGQAGQWAIVGNTDTIWVWDTDTSAWVDTSQNINLSDYYTKEQADERFARAVAYVIDVPTTGWTTGSLTWGGTTYTRQCTVTAADATASPTSVTMAYEGGDYGAYCQIALLDTQAGSVVLWATQDPTATYQIRVVEVRPGASE
ncbi:MAG: hypothetical protein ACLT3F_04615 [Gemmiger formicilis]|uniref:hypothetical protein n=1 Tax=Gemmiger formicilis TaxID=745368 RepID=UPI003993EDEE